MQAREFVDRMCWLAKRLAKGQLLLEEEGGAISASSFSSWKALWLRRVVLPLCLAKIRLLLLSARLQPKYLPQYRRPPHSPASAPQCNQRHSACFSNSKPPSSPDTQYVNRQHSTFYRPSSPTPNVSTASVSASAHFPPVSAPRCSSANCSHHAHVFLTTNSTTSSPVRLLRHSSTKNCVSPFIAGCQSDTPCTSTSILITPRASPPPHSSATITTIFCSSPPRDGSSSLKSLATHST
ncbi:hypothetical protein KP509_25G068100 [Ceratopteris richardii]|uniref:Uncharacterized protein n=1 Tax=Ceratopteris richardii TaxID=49495 RepID=A0A8T2RRC9_CERRI|nr:hypothetical protein KP509_25G068100 [Ceratopteris richardii]